MDPNTIDDVILALELQLEELREDDSCDKGKYPEGQLPDSTRAVREYQAEVAACLQRLTDHKLAHSIAHAVATDGPVIASLMDLEAQDEEDRRAALQTSIDDPELKSPATPRPCELDGTGEGSSTRAFMQTQKNYYSKGPSWGSSLVRVLGDNWGFQTTDDESDERATSSSQAWRKSPPPAYTKHQEKVLKTFSSPGLTCCACAGQFRPTDVFRLDCGDVFCRACLKKLIKTSIQDMTMFPPKCHRRPISDQIVRGLLSAQELEEFRNREVEASCSVKTYCSNTSCGRFIPPAQIRADRADCDRCGTSTCTNCRNKYHTDDCPKDLALQATLALADAKKWQRCFSCRAVVMLAKACNHVR